MVELKVDPKTLARLAHAVGVTGGAGFLVLAWFTIALFYMACILMAFVFADLFHAVAVRHVPVREAEFLWWFAVAVLILGTSYGFRLAVEFVGENTGADGESKIAALARDYGVLAFRRAPTPEHERPVTGPSAQEIAQNRPGYRGR